MLACATFPAQRPPPSDQAVCSLLEIVCCTSQARCLRSVAALKCAIGSTPKPKSFSAQLVCSQQNKGRV